MSWIGGSISSLTGQLTNLTKDILTEGTEEVSDHATELRLAQEKIKEVEATCNALRTENERLKKINLELDEKAESAELQINSISREYRILLEEKESKINSLKQKHHELLDHQAKAAILTPSSAQFSRETPNASTALAAGGAGGGGLHGEDWDFADSINLQHEVNRLGHEVQRLQAECQHWRTVAGQLGEADDHGSKQDFQQAQLLASWQSKVKELEAQLHQERERLQHEIASLQDVYNQKTSALKRKHKQEVSELKSQLQSLEQQLTEGKDGDSLRNNGVSNLPEADRAPPMEEDGAILRQLREEVASLRQDRESMELLKQEMETQVLDLRTERDGYQATISEQKKLISDLQRKLEEEASSSQLQIRELSQQLEESKEQLQQLEAEHQKREELKEDMTEIQSDHQQLQAESTTMIKNMGDPVHQQLTADLMNSIEKENLVLKEKNLRLEEQITLLEKLAQTHLTEKQASETRVVELKRQLKNFEGHSSDGTSTPDQSLSTSDIGMSGTENQSDAEQMSVDATSLKAQLEQYRQEVEQFEMVKADWQMEKEALEEVLLQLREDLQEKERTIQTLHNTQINHTDADHDKEDETQQGRQLEVDKELKKCKLELEQLTVEKGSLSEKADNLEKQLSELHEAQSITDELKRQLAEHQQQVAALQEERETLESSLEELDSQHTQATDQLISIRDKLTQRVDDLTTELANRDGQMEALTKQLSDQTDEIEGLKTQLSNRESDINALTTQLSLQKEKVDSLTKELENASMVSAEVAVEKTIDADVEGPEREHLSDVHNAEGKHLQSATDKKIADLEEKLRKGAVAVNELHMDKRELEEALKTSKREVAAKVDKIKELKRENTRLKDANRDMVERVQEAEDELEKLQEVHGNMLANFSQTEDKEEQFQELAAQNQQLRDREQQQDQDLKCRDEEILQQREEIQKVNKLLEEEQERIVQLNELSENRAQENRQLQQEISSVTAKKKELETQLEGMHQKPQKDLKSREDDKKMKDLLETCSLKDMRISDLEEMVGAVQADLYGTQAALQAAQKNEKSFKEDIEIKQQEVDSLNKEIANLTQYQKLLQTQIEQEQTVAQDLVDREQELQQEVLMLRDQLDQMSIGQTDASKADQQHRQDTEIIAQLELETDQAREKIVQLEREMKSYKETVDNQKSEISRLGHQLAEQEKFIQKEQDKCSQLDLVISRLQSDFEQKNLEFQSLQQKLNKALSFLDENTMQLFETEYVDSNKQSLNSPVLESHKKEVVTLSQSQPPNRVGVEEKRVNDYDRGEQEIEDALEVETISHEMEELQQRLDDKDQVITELQQNNAALLKMLEARSVMGHGDRTQADFHKLENELKSLRSEKEQIMAVMNEKSRECSSLRSEVHRLMNVVSAEKSALAKLQKDNHELTQTKTSAVDDMQKEALQNLSRLVRDRDLEIEALKQKNETLLAVLQDSSQEGSRISTMLTDSENLSKQVATFQAEREQMIAYLNQKHQESITYHNEVQRLTQLMETESQKFEKMQQEYENLMPQFEDKKQALLKAQNDLINYRQKYGELEVKYGELVQRSNITDTVDKSAFNAKEEELKNLTSRQVELQKTIQEKDNRIHELVQASAEKENSLLSKDTERTNLRKQLEHVTFQMQGFQNEISDLKTENAALLQKFSEFERSSQGFKEENTKLTLLVREKDFEVSSLREKCDTLTAVLQEQQGEQGQVERLMKDSEAQLEQARLLQQERDQMVLAVQQLQMQREELHRDNAKMKEKEMKLSKELDRLRSHLLQIEEGYTREALDAEEREKDLRNRLAVAEESLVSSTSAVETASQQASLQVESLQQQLGMVGAQRDAAYQQITILQDQCQQYASSLANLQIVLEQFQQDKDAQVSAETERYEVEIKKLKEQVNTLQASLDQANLELEEASDGLEAAARLSEQLDRREEALNALREEVHLRESALKMAEEEIKRLTTSTEARVDRLLMKNLLLGYFSTPENKRVEVVRTIGGVLNFTPEDFQKVLGNKSSGWIPGFLRFGAKPTPPSSPSRHMVHPSQRSLDSSFSELFVKFLERESSPPPPAVRLPAEKMAQELQQKHKDREKAQFNPFTAPKHVSMPVQVGEHTSRSNTHILMAPMSPTLPVLAPLSDSSGSLSGSGRSTPQTSSAILKDVLGSR